MNRKNELFLRLGEPLAAGMYERENDSVVERYGLGLRRYFEHAEPPPESGPLYPAPEQNLWGLGGRLVRFHYAWGIQVDGNGLRKAAETLDDPFERAILREATQELEFFQSSAIPPRYAIGGRGWTHAVLNYRRILEEGLGRYRERVGAMRDSPLRRALSDLFAGLDDFLGRAPGTIRSDVEHPARDFRTAMRSFNFFYALDEYDSAGRFDDYVGAFYQGEPEAEEYVCQLFRASDLHFGWHILHTGKYPEFTRICLRAQRLRRPNSGLLIRPDTPPEIWSELFDAWGAGIPCPALYNEAAYLAAAEKYADAAPEDRERFAFGGCTELMFEGCSNIGSTEGGINLIDILNNSTTERFHHDIRLRLEELSRSIRLDSEHAALYRPQLIRTLFIDDCIDRELEYNAGGARYYGSIINMAGLTNAADALAARQGVRTKFGNDAEAADAIAAGLARYAFGEACKLPGRRGGPCYPAVIMFTTYAQHGSYVDASEDGRRAGDPVVDSAGALSGADREGPTALLNSVAKLPAELGLGTLVLNLRIQRSLAASPDQRPRLEALVRGFFDQGGLQIQATLIDQETLRKAYENPEAFPHLIVRIGGYSEYYQKLDRDLQLELLKRTEHMIS